MIFLCRRRPDLDRAEYARRVLEGHVPLALEHHPELQRYVVNIARAEPEGAPEIDSLPTLDFASLDTFRERLFDSAEGQAEIERDVERFMGPPADAYATEATLHLDRSPVTPLGSRSPHATWMIAVVAAEGSPAEEVAARVEDEGVRRLLARDPLRLVTDRVVERLTPEAPRIACFVELALRAGAPAPPELAGLQGVAASWPFAVDEYVQQRIRRGRRG